MTPALSASLAIAIWLAASCLLAVFLARFFHDTNDRARRSAEERAGEWARREG